MSLRDSERGYQVRGRDSTEAEDDDLRAGPYASDGKTWLSWTGKCVGLTCAVILLSFLVVQSILWLGAVPDDVGSAAAVRTSTDEPTETPSEAPTAAPSASPTAAPTSEGLELGGAHQPPHTTRNPTWSGSPPRTTPRPSWSAHWRYPRPTLEPSSDPTAQPTADPSPGPTTDPSPAPTATPTTAELSETPTTAEPTTDPSPAPTATPTTAEPSATPTTAEPTQDPSPLPTADPTTDPSADPTSDPTTDPSADPTAMPTVSWPVNVVLVIVDDMGWSDYSYVYEDYDMYMTIDTPHLDSFFKESQVFLNYYTNTICTPSRASIMTGRYTYALGMQATDIVNNCKSGALPLGIPTFAEILKYKNYTNHYAGKWNLGYFSWLNTPLGRGWDTFFGSFNYPNTDFRGSLHSWKGTTGEKCSDVTYHEAIPNVDVFEKCCAKCTGFEAAYFDSTNSICKCYNECDTETTYDSNDELYTASKVTFFDFWNNTEPYLPDVNLSADDSIITEVTRLLIDHVEDPDPWSITVAFTMPHEDKSYLPNGTNSELYPDCERFFTWGGPYYNWNRGVQCQRVRELDEHFGELLTILKNFGVWQDTILMVLSDNPADPGQFATEHTTNYGLNWPYRGGKLSLFDGGLRTPLAVGGGALPDNERGIENNDLHGNTDILPTIMAVAGFSQEEIDHVDHDGFPLFTVGGIEAEAHEEIIHTMPVLTPSSDSVIRINNGSVIRVGDMKYTTGFFENNYQLGGWATLPESLSIQDVHDCTNGCLYNISADPQEFHNLLDDPDYADLVNSLDDRIDEIINSAAFDPGQQYTPTPTSTCPYIVHEGYNYYTPFDDPSVLFDPIREG